MLHKLYLLTIFIITIRRRYRDNKKIILIAVTWRLLKGDSFKKTVKVMPIL